MKGKSGSMKSSEGMGGKGRSPRLAARPSSASPATRTPTLSARRHSGSGQPVTMATKRPAGTSPRTSDTPLTDRVKRTRPNAEKDYAKMAEGEPVALTPNKASTSKQASIRTRLSTGSIHMNGTTTVSVAKERAELESIVQQINKSEHPSSSKAALSHKKKVTQSGPEESDHPPPKKRKIGRNDGSGEDNRNDYFCWLCHKEGSLICCELCPRVYHARCLGLGADLPADWVCPECEKIMQAECVDTRSKSMEMLTLDQLATLLTYALDRMMHEGSEPFQNPVDVTKVPNYSDYIFYPMDLSILRENVKKKVYGCTEAFLADVKWILHNCIVYNSTHSKLTSSAKMIVKICKHEMNEIELCPDCYLNSCIRENDDWFSEPCRVPHTLVWAKLKGYPFWPSKALREINGEVDVRFFGAHDRSWVPVSQCFLLSKNIPTSLQKGKKNAGLDGAIEELNIHINKLRDQFGHFEYAPFRTPYDKTDAYKPISLKPTNGKQLKPSSGITGKMSMALKTASGIKSKYSAMMTTKKLDASPEKHRQGLREPKDETDGGERGESDIDVDDGNRNTSLQPRLVVKQMQIATDASNTATFGDLGSTSSSSGTKSGGNDKQTTNSNEVNNSNEGDKKPVVKGIKMSFVSTDLVDRLAKKLEEADKSDEGESDFNTKAEDNTSSETNTKSVSDSVSSDSSEKMRNEENKVEKDIAVTSETGTDNQASETNVKSLEDEQSEKNAVPSETETAVLDVGTCVTENEKSANNNANINRSEAEDVMDKMNTDINSDGSENTAKEDKVNSVEGGTENTAKKDKINSAEGNNDFRKKLETTISVCKAKLAMDETASSSDDELDEDSDSKSDDSNSSNELDYESYESSDGSGHKVDKTKAGTEKESEIDEDKSLLESEPADDAEVVGEALEEDKGKADADVDEARKKDEVSGGGIESVLTKTDAIQNTDNAIQNTDKENMEGTENTSEASKNENSPNNQNSDKDIKSSVDVNGKDSESLPTNKDLHVDKIGNDLNCGNKNVETENVIENSEAELQLEDKSAKIAESEKSVEDIREIELIENQIQKVTAQDDTPDSKVGCLNDKPKADDTGEDKAMEVDSSDSLKKSDNELKHKTELTKKSPYKKQELDASTGELMEVEAKKSDEELDHDSDALVIDTDMEESSPTVKQKTQHKPLSETTVASCVQAGPSSDSAGTSSNTADSSKPPNFVNLAETDDEVEPVGDTRDADTVVADKVPSDMTVVEKGSEASGTSKPSNEKNVPGQKQGLKYVTIRKPLDCSKQASKTGSSPSENTEIEASMSKMTKTADSIADKFSKKLLATLQEALHEMREEVQTEQSKNSGVAEMNRLLAQARWDYTSELTEMRQNFNLTVTEMKNCWLAEKDQIEKVLKDQIEKMLNAKHAEEMAQKIKEVKKKQWCAFCEKEAIFYCCWNTSYCDYPCQQNHWPTHMHTCLQTNKNSDKSAPTSSSDTAIEKATPVQSNIVMSSAAAPTNINTNVVMATATPITSTVMVSQNVTDIYRQPMGNNVIGMIGREEDRRSADRRANHISPKYVPMSSPPVHNMHNIHQVRRNLTHHSSPVSIATNLIYPTMSPQNHNLMRANQQTMMATMQQAGNQFINSAQMAVNRPGMQALPAGPSGMVLPQAMGRPLYPVQMRPMAQPMPGTILFQNQQQSMMGYGVRPNF